MSARIRDHGTGADWRVPTVQEIRHPMDGEDLDKHYARLAALGFASYPPEDATADDPKQAVLSVLDYSTS
jgi:hypothetical protein